MVTRERKGFCVLDAEDEFVSVSTDDIAVAELLRWLIPRDTIIIAGLIYRNNLEWLYRIVLLLLCDVQFINSGRFNPGFRETYRKGYVYEGLRYQM